jgi:predicted transcriptional regulator
VIVTPEGTSSPGFLGEIMAKEIIKLLDNIREDLDNLGMKAEELTLSMLIYTSPSGSVATRTGQIRFNLEEVVEALEVINKKLNAVNKLKKRIEKLEKK